MIRNLFIYINSAGNCSLLVHLHRWSSTGNGCHVLAMRRTVSCLGGSAWDDNSWNDLRLGVARAGHCGLVQGTSDIVAHGLVLAFAMWDYIRVIQHSYRNHWCNSCALVSPDITDSARLWSIHFHSAPQCVHLTCPWYRYDNGQCIFTISGVHRRVAPPYGTRLVTLDLGVVSTLPYPWPLGQFLICLFVIVVPLGRRGGYRAGS